MAICVLRFSPPDLPWFPAPPVASLAVGVAQRAAASGRLCEFLLGDVMPFESRAIGVGHNPEPVTSLRGSDFSRADTRPFRIEPEPGKVTQHDVETVVT